MILALNSLQISLKWFYFPVKLYFWIFLGFPWLSSLKLLFSPLRSAPQHTPARFRLFPSSSQRGTAGPHGRTSSFPPSRLFSTSFVGRGCVGVDSSLPPLIPVGIGSSIEGFLPKMVAESACRFWVRVIHVWYRSMAVTPSDGALGMCRCVFHGQCLSVIAASFYLFQSEWCTPPRDKKQWGHWEKQL